MSNGGDFCYLLACQASTVFQAVAPVAGMIMQDIMDACNPYSTTNILEIHGTEDDVTYYDGDPTNQDGWGAVRRPWISSWTYLDWSVKARRNCDATDGSEVEVMAWSNETDVRGSNCTKSSGAATTGPARGATWTSMRAWVQQHLAIEHRARPAIGSINCARHVGHAGASLSSQCGRTTYRAFQRPSARFSGLRSDGRPPSQRHLHADVRSFVYAVVRDRHGLETVRFIEVDGGFETCVSGAPPAGGKRAGCIPSFGGQTPCRGAPHRRPFAPSP